MHILSECCVRPSAYNSFDVRGHSTHSRPVLSRQNISSHYRIVDTICILSYVQSSYIYMIILLLFPGSVVCIAKHNRGKCRVMRCSQ